jgi:transcriptional regulator
MYVPKHFEQNDPAALAALMRARPLASIVRHGPDGLTADPIPLELAADGALLRGHVARANPLWREAHGQPVLAIFHGADAYVSPSAYPGKSEHGKVVPTWNYAIVHAHAALHAVDDAPWLHELVQRLTNHHEAPRAVPWKVGDAPADYVQQMLRAIVGIELRITRLVGKWKLSQNRSAADRDGVARLLAEGDAEARAVAAMIPKETR